MRNTACFVFSMELVVWMVSVAQKVMTSWSPSAGLSKSFCSQLIAIFMMRKVGLQSVTWRCPMVVIKVGGILGHSLVLVLFRLINVNDTKVQSTKRYFLLIAKNSAVSRNFRS